MLSKKARLWITVIGLVQILVMVVACTSPNPQVTNPVITPTPTESMPEVTHPDQTANARTDDDPHGN